MIGADIGTVDKLSCTPDPTLSFSHQRHQIASTLFQPWHFDMHHQIHAYIYYTDVCICICIYTHVYIEGNRERQREGEKETEAETYRHDQLYKIFLRIYDMRPNKQYLIP